MRAPRYQFEVPIQIFWGSLSFEALTYNASQSGFFIETATPLWIGATFSAELASRLAFPNRSRRVAMRVLSPIFPGKPSSPADLVPIKSAFFCCAGDRATLV